MKIRTFLFISSFIVIFILLTIIFIANQLKGTIVFHIFKQQVEFAHPHYARDFYELYGQTVIVPCTNVWDLSQRTNSRIRLWGIGLDGYKPFIEWQKTSIDVNGNIIYVK